MSAIPPFDPKLLGAALAESRVVAVAVVRNGAIVFANAAFRTMFDADDTLLGAPFGSLGDGADDALCDAATAPAGFAARGQHADGQAFDLELTLETVVLDGEPAVLAFAADITGQHRSDQRLACLAYTDELTGLPNRALFADRLQQALLAAKRGGGVFGVLMIDLDGFKAVNDRFGHAAGDLVLCTVGQRFEGAIRQSDTLARLGGDEFAVILSRLDCSATATRVAERLIVTLEAPFELRGQLVTIGASVGIATYPNHASSADLLLAAADAAMYQAKQAGSGRIEFAEQVTGSVVALLPLRWSAAHAVGVRAIDDQHYHMAQLIDAVSVALKDAAEPDDIAAQLNELISFTEFHFASEERLMAAHHVANAAPHRDAHRRLLEDIRNLRLDRDLPSVSLVLRYLQEWLVRHVDGLDKELGQALMAKGTS